jgi:hypothetical protein
MASSHPFQLHFVADGHGSHGQLVSHFIKQEYPGILKRLVTKSLNQFNEYEKGLRMPSPVPQRSPNRAGDEEIDQMIEEE